MSLYNQYKHKTDVSYLYRHACFLYNTRVIIGNGLFAALVQCVRFSFLCGNIIRARRKYALKIGFLCAARRLALFIPFARFFVSCLLCCFPFFCAVFVFRLCVWHLFFSFIVFFVVVSFCRLSFCPLCVFVSFSFSFSFPFASLCLLTCLLSFLLFVVFLSFLCFAI